MAHSLFLDAQCLGMCQISERLDTLPMFQVTVSLSSCSRTHCFKSSEWSTSQAFGSLLTIQSQNGRNHQTETVRKYNGCVQIKVINRSFTNFKKRALQTNVSELQLFVIDAVVGDTQFLLKYRSNACKRECCNLCTERTGHEASKHGGKVDTKGQTSAKT